MKLSNILFAFAAGLGIPSLTLAAPGTPGSTQDPSSSSNVDAFKPSHLEMDYIIDFDTSTTSGTITHYLTVLEADTTTVFMDMWDAVEVSKAEFWMDPSVNASEAVSRQGFVYIAAETPMEADFEITIPNPNTGKAIGITVPEMPEGSMFYVRLTYRSLPNSGSLSWLTPEQTAAKTKPFVYSLCQMNFCRDWAPMMDTPSQKITYNASITAPNGYVVSMSGNETGITPYNDTWTTTTFECMLKIPSYQIALIVGDLEMVDLGGRVKVFAEAPYIDAAVSEFEDLPDLLAETEAYLTPYIWGNYSIFVMPPSFAWGGMEHINANQVSHTLLTGDKSMLGTAIHEITHSWFGNDVGCKNWNHFWINEGMNTFMDRKMLGSYYGEEYAKIDYYTGNTSMYYGDMLDYYGLNNSYSSLFPDVGDDDPENSFSGIPYNKGAQFMYYIESFLGDSAMQAMLRAYIGHFSQQAIDQAEFKAWYNGWLVENFPTNATELMEMTMWDTWILEPGLGPVQIDVATTALFDAEALASEYLELNTSGTPLTFSDYNGYYPEQQEAFIQKLDTSDGVTADLMAHIDNDLAIIESNHPSVKTKWYRLGIKLGYDPILDPTYVWLGQQGRSAYCTPIFRDLVKYGRCDLATEWFDEYGPTYNSYIHHYIEIALEPCAEDSDESSAPEEGATESSELTLVNADTNEDIGPLTDGMILDFTVLPDHINLRADPTAPWPIGSVQFQLNGNVVREESAAPFAIAGDEAGDYFTWEPPSGDHTLVVIAFSEAGIQGDNTEPIVVEFTVINGFDETAAPEGDGDGTAEDPEDTDEATSAAESIGYVGGTLFAILALSFLI